MSKITMYFLYKMLDTFHHQYYNISVVNYVARGANAEKEHINTML